MTYLKNWSAFVVVLILGMLLASCNKDNLVESDQTPTTSKLMLDDLREGQFYTFDQLDQSVLDILEIDPNDVKNHARSVTYKILQYHEDYTVNDTYIEIEYPNSSTVNLEGNLLWEKNPVWNGTYIYRWKGNSSDTQRLQIKRYTVGSGGLNVVTNYTYGPSWDSTDPDRYGMITFSDGGWVVGSMSTY